MRRVRRRHPSADATTPGRSSSWGYDYNVKAGEDIRILDVTDWPCPELPDHDFWLFDDSTVVKLLYRPDGTQIGRELVEHPDLEAVPRLA